jgi:hypothetical protein
MCLSLACLFENLVNGSSERMLSYELLHHVSLDRLFFGSLDGRFMDWSTCLKVAAKNLAFLHNEGPFQMIDPKLRFL